MAAPYHGMRSGYSWDWQGSGENLEGEELALERMTHGSSQGGEPLECARVRSSRTWTLESGREHGRAKTTGDFGTQLWRAVSAGAESVDLPPLVKPLGYALAAL